MNMETQDNKNPEQPTDGTQKAATQGGEGQPAPVVASPDGFNLGDGAGDGSNARVAELEHQLATARVEQGRVRALADENKALKQQNAELQAQIDALRAERKDYMAELPQELRDQVDPAAIKAFGTLLDKRTAETERREREREEARKAEDAYRADRMFEVKIEQAFPGFMKKTSAGGELYAPWMKFLGMNKALVCAAYNAHDLSALSTLINLFFETAGVQGRDGKPATDAPTPTPAASARDIISPDGNKKVYTREEYAQAVEKAGREYREGTISREDYMKIRAELSTALNEGRIR